jgi:PAS domain S-box-containing protein
MQAIPTEDQCRKLFDHARDVIYTLSPQGVIMSLNPAFETLTGWAPSEWVGRLFGELIHPDDSPSIIQKFQRILQGASLPLSETRILTSSGNYKFVECLETQETANDRIIGVLGIARDITERALAEQARRDSEQQFRQVVENIREVFWMSDPSKEKMLYISPGYQEIWGRTCESLYASPRSWLDWIYPDDRPHILKASQTKQTVGSYNEEYRIVRPDGSIRWIHDRAFPIRDQVGAVYRIAGIAEDITERKILQDKVRDSNQALANLAVRLQTIREEERTRISLDLHDQLGQTLVAGKFYLQWMDEALSGGTFLNVLSVWHARLKSVIREMDLTLAAVQRICFDLRPAELDQLGLVAALERQVREFADHTRISCETDIQVDDARMTSEQATALFRILQEALTNIAKHARATQVDIRLTEEDGQSKLYIHDNGVGIQESRINDQTSLGLLGMRERLRPLNGHLQITGSQGEGTMLVVRLPLRM